MSVNVETVKYYSGHCDYPQCDETVIDEAYTDWAADKFSDICYLEDVARQNLWYVGENCGLYCPMHCKKNDDGDLIPATEQDMKELEQWEKEHWKRQSESTTGKTCRSMTCCSSEVAVMVSV
jgi:hypothetical protein